MHLFGMFSAATHDQMTFSRLLTVVVLGCELAEQEKSRITKVDFLWHATSRRQSIARYINSTRGSEGRDGPFGA
jgi:hypothetical protein